jgi:hypothetical protein
MFSANSPFWANSVNNGSTPFTTQYTGVSNPLGLSNNYAFGRIWPANAPFGDGGVGSSSILDPTGLPLASPNPPFHAPNPLIGGVYVGTLTNRGQVSPPQIIPGGLNTGAVGTVFLGPSPDGSCKAVFAVVTADGAIAQEHTLRGLDGLAPAATIRPLVGRTWDPPDNHIEPRLGVLMTPYIPTGAPAGTVLQLFVSEPFNETVAVVNLGVLNGQVFQAIGSVIRFSSSSLHLPVDLTPVHIDRDDPQWASNTTLDGGSDFYVLNRGNSTIVRMSQNGSVVAVRRVNIDSSSVANASLNGIATSADGSTIYLTFVGPGNGKGGVLAVSSF